MLCTSGENLCWAGRWQEAVSWSCQHNITPIKGTRWCVTLDQQRGFTIGAVKQRNTQDHSELLFGHQRYLQVSIQDASNGPIQQMGKGGSTLCPPAPRSNPVVRPFPVPRKSAKPRQQAAEPRPGPRRHSQLRGPHGPAGTRRLRPARVPGR